MTQNDRIIEYIKRFGSISTYEAFTELGITRLSARIYDLQAAGYDFNRETVHAINRLGESVSYTRYSLKV
jgi:hypothetical protein